MKVNEGGQRADWGEIPMRTANIPKTRAAVTQGMVSYKSVTAGEMLGTPPLESVQDTEKKGRGVESEIDALARASLRGLSEYQRYNSVEVQVMPVCCKCTCLG